jgi:hypothetical protein
MGLAGRPWKRCAGPSIRKNDRTEKEKNSMMNRVAILLIATMSLAAGSVAQEFVSTRGKQIISPDGSPLLLRGINVGNWLNPEGYMFEFDTAASARMINDVVSELLGPDEAVKFWETFRDNYITHDDIRFISSLGLNSIRVPFNYKLFTPEDHPDVWLPTGFEMLDRIIGWCKEEGLYVILDMHCAPGGQTGANIDDSRSYPFLFTSERSQERTIEIWKRIAKRYAAEPTVIGYDLLNEPLAHYFEDEDLSGGLEPLYKRIVKAIRTVDTNHIVFLGGGRWNTDFRPFGKPFDSKLVYTFHKYWMPPEQNEIQEYVDFRDRYDVPIWMGESGENTHGWIDSFRVLLEENDIGWCFWTYKRLNTRRSVMSITRPDDWGIISSYADGPRVTYEDVRENRPSVKISSAVLREYVSKTLFGQCRPNPGYIRALGISSQMDK